jgi:hypothetical protein
MHFDDGAILEMVIWRVPTPANGSTLTTSTGSSTATLERELSDKTTSAQREIIGTLANRKTRAFSRTWRHWSEIFSPTYLERGQQMKKATIRIRRESQTAQKEMGDRFVTAWKTGKSDGDLLQFESAAPLFRALTAKRWELRSQPF